jgi:hypothetical protein
MYNTMGGRNKTVVLLLACETLSEKSPKEKGLEAWLKC